MLPYVTSPSLFLCFFMHLECLTFTFVVHSILLNGMKISIKKALKEQGQPFGVPLVYEKLSLIAIFLSYSIILPKKGENKGVSFFL